MAKVTKFISNTGYLRSVIKLFNSKADETDEWELLLATVEGSGNCPNVSTWVTKRIVLSKYDNPLDNKELFNLIREIFEHEGDI